uniref:Uncharacterized protein n=1 Tax=Meloidogyne javanica TaxID=6303 RepID=A0A915MJD0_MELJA
MLEVTTTMSEEMMFASTVFLYVFLVIGAVFTFILCCYCCCQKDDKNVKKKPTPAPIEILEQKYSRTEAIIICEKPEVNSLKSLPQSQPSSLPVVSLPPSLPSERSLPVFSTQPSRSILSEPKQRSVTTARLPNPSDHQSNSLPSTSRRYPCTPPSFNASYTIISPVPFQGQHHQQASTMKSKKYSNRSRRSSRRSRRKYGRKHDESDYSRRSHTTGETRSKRES